MIGHYFSFNSKHNQNTLTPLSPPPPSQKNNAILYQFKRTSRPWNRNRNILKPNMCRIFFFFDCMHSNSANFIMFVNIDEGSDDDEQKTDESM